MPDRFQSRPVKTLVPQFKKEQEPFGSTDNFLEGLITDDDPVRIPLNALTIAENVVYTRKMLFRRNGLTAYSIAKPDSNPVIALYAFVHQGTGINILRFTRSKIYRAGISGWTEITADPGGVALTGSDRNYFTFSFADNRAFFSNGKDPIREILPSTSKYSALGNAPTYRYITAAFNRLVGVYRIGSPNIPIEVGWSGDRNYDEWDPLVDISAGSTPLVDSPSDTSDEPTGIFNQESLLIIPRQRSIWLATKLPSATNPFNFYPAIPKVGADNPRTIQLTDYGLIWYNHKNAAVYLWNVAEGENQPIPTDLAGKIRVYLKSLVGTSLNVWSSYSGEHRSYSIYIEPRDSQTTIVFTYNFITSAWTVEKYLLNAGISSVLDIDFTTTITINDLTGSINNLVGSISSLGGVLRLPNTYFGFNNGEMATQSGYSGLSEQTVYANDVGISYESVVATKTITKPIEDLYINIVGFDYTPYSTGSITIEYSKDDALTWVTEKVLTVDGSMIGKNDLVLIKKALKGRRFIWRIRTSDCMLALTGFHIRAPDSGITK